MTRADDQAIDETGPASTRDRLLEAAAAEIAEVGWDAARTRSIAARAGVNPGVVHYHFDSMEALLVEAATRAMITAVEGPALALLVEPDFVTAVGESLRLVAAMDVAGADGRILMEVMVQAGRRPVVGRIMAETLAGYRAALADRIRRDIAAGELSAAIDPDGMAQLIAALLDGVALHRYVDPHADFTPLAEMIDRLIGGTEHE